MEIVAVFKESFFLLLKQPKLFLPKLLVAALWGLGMIVLATTLVEVISMLSMPVLDIDIERAYFFQNLIIVLIIYLIALAVIDILANAMYPVMIKDFREGGKISFNRALRFALRKFPIVFPAIIIAASAIAIPFGLLFLLFIPSGNFIALVFSIFLFLALAFALTILFYLVYPVAVLEKGNFISALVDSFRIGKSNLKQLSVPSLIPFFLSLISIPLAFFPSNVAALLSFIILRFLVALIATYHMVLNPNVYFALVGKGGIMK